MVVDGVMYVTSANDLFALDARPAAALALPPAAHQGLTGDAAGALNRGVAVLGDRVFMVTDHAHLIALDRITGAPALGYGDGGLPAALRCARARRW